MTGSDTASPPTTAPRTAHLLGPVPARRPPRSRRATMGAVLRDLLTAGDLDLPLPGSGGTAWRWSRLAALGRWDLPSARLAEGHADAVAILAEHGRTPHEGAAYGVWASRASGGATLHTGPRGRRLSGTVRYCSGTHLLDRALVVAGADAGTRLVELDLNAARIERRPGAWRAAGMAASDTHDVALHDVPVRSGDVIGGPDAYTGRPGFAHGGAGVAAVWLGGAAGVLDDLATALRDGDPEPDPHRLAAFGRLYAEITAADAALTVTAATIDAHPERPHRHAAAAVRATVEACCRSVLDTAPEIAGVGLLAGSPHITDRLTDLQVYIRQHHGARDLAALGEAVLSDADGS